jgi:drug/metabolite transporter (DMT)-like permease
LSTALHTDRVGLGIASSLSAVFCFAIVHALAKWLGQDYPAVQILFFRYLFGLLPVAVFVWRSGGLPVLRTRRPATHALRAGLLFVALLLFFEALQSLPLAEVIAVYFTAPLFVTALAAPVLGETVGPRRWTAVIVGFLGALIMVRPGTAAFHPEATQRIVHTPQSSVLAFVRDAVRQQILVLVNMAGSSVSIDWSTVPRNDWRHELIADSPVDTANPLLLAPYQAVWLSCES